MNRRQNIQRARNHLRTAYHQLADDLLKNPPEYSTSEIERSFNKASEAIEALNRELGLPYGS